MSFKDYYQNEFRSDFNFVIEGAKTMKEYGQHVIDKQPALQSMTVSMQNPSIKAWSQSKRDNFAVALFYTVLIDQACYTHFQFFYNQFRKLTLYPKYIGQCLSLCHTHQHPSKILKHVGCDKGVDNSTVEPSQLSSRLKLVLESAPLMKKEILEFCENFMPELDCEELWTVCSDHITILGNANS